MRAINVHSLREESDMTDGRFADVRVERVFSMATEYSNRSDCKTVHKRWQAALEVAGDENFRVARSTTLGQ